MASFDDGKEDGALRTIGELTDALGIKAHVLRYWEGQFPTLQPLKRSGGRRYYRPEDVALVQEIDRLVNREGYTLRGAKAALRNFRKPGREAAPLPEQVNGSSFTPAIGIEGAQISPEIVARLRAVRSRMAEALAS